MENTARLHPERIPELNRNLAKQISETKREQLYRTWRDRPNLSHVGRICQVSFPTVKKYSLLDNWAERRRMDMERESSIGATMTLDDVKSEQIVYLRDVRRDAHAKATGLEYKSAREAAMTVIDCGKAELDLMGMATPKGVSLVASALEKLARLQGLKHKQGATNAPPPASGQGAGVDRAPVGAIEACVEITTVQDSLDKVVENKPCETEPETPQIEGK